jgi:hypothetical protein
MKHETLPSPEIMYRALHRQHTVRFIIALSLLSWCAIGSIIAAYYGLTMPAIWGMLLSIFLLVVAMVEGRLCDTYYDKWIRLAAKGLPKIDYPN